MTIDTPRAVRRCGARVVITLALAGPMIACEWTRADDAPMPAAAAASQSGPANADATAGQPRRKYRSVRGV
jgi:hypothetical protein